MLKVSVTSTMTKASTFFSHNIKTKKKKWLIIFTLKFSTTFDERS